MIVDNKKYKIFLVPYDRYIIYNPKGEIELQITASVPEQNVGLFLLVHLKAFAKGVEYGKQNSQG